MHSYLGGSEHIASASVKTIGLCMVVKNEASVILRCLASVRSLIDYALIVDTGSTDGTQSLIKKYLEEQRLAGAVIAEPWRDFAYNRSFALAKLRERTDIDYALVLDADDVLVLSAGFDAPRFKTGLDKDFYHVEIHLGSGNAAGTTRLWRPQILNNRVEFSYKGVLYEFVTGPEAATAHAVATRIHIAAGTDGVRSRNPHKYRDDALTLEKAIESETDEFIRARYLFYLGHSWMHAGEKEKALQAYLQRAELGFFHEEAALSLYHAAQLKDALGYPDTEIIGSYLKAYEADPKRTEPLHGAMDYCRRNSKPYQGYLIGKHAITIPEPIGSLLVASWLYDYGALEEFSVLSYHSGHYRECIQAIERLLADGKIPESARKRLRDNARIATEALAGPALTSAQAAAVAR